MRGGIGLSPRQKAAQQFVDLLRPAGYALGYERRLHKGQKRKRFYEIGFDAMDYAGRVAVLGERYFRIEAYAHNRSARTVEAFTRDLPSALLGVGLLCGLERPERASELLTECRPLAEFLAAG